MQAAEHQEGLGTQSLQQPPHRAPTPGAHESSTSRGCTPYSCHTRVRVHHVTVPLTLTLLGAPPAPCRCQEATSGRGYGSIQGPPVHHAHTTWQWPEPAKEWGWCPYCDHDSTHVPHPECSIGLCATFRPDAHRPDAYWTYIGHHALCSMLHAPCPVPLWQALDDDGDGTLSYEELAPALINPSAPLCASTTAPDKIKIWTNSIIRIKQMNYLQAKPV